MTAKQMTTDLKQRIKTIRWVLTDCDGVLTDAGVYYGPDGERLKRFNMRDGMGVERLRTLTGIDVGIVTGETSAIVAARARKLNIVELHSGARDKLAVLQAFMERLGLHPAEIAYIGDDVNDLAVLPIVGVSACPADAVASVKKVVNYVCQLPGGHGCFRELAELIIDVHQSESTQESETLSFTANQTEA